MRTRSKALRAKALSRRLYDYTSDMNVRIVEFDDYYRLILDPVSGEGHDINIELDKKTCRIKDLVVSTFEPEHARVRMLQRQA